MLFQKFIYFSFPIFNNFFLNKKDKKKRDKKGKLNDIKKKKK